ncbi:Phthiocerol synthesis polyketide synthase type I PpsC [Baekduia alba]|uniref:quinone oxidoreductase family protein n=1 Tax=Baekduia alba TaxID=2997333 RepID=UPI0023409C0A|nr:zinc-binding dehydrogenase [Baekduia alba]WCB96493.1 Phthiocerol synthesis polyketide synthase type I PpsC [Baekduia alba]
MRAVVFDAPAPDGSTTRVADLPVPEPGPGELTIDVHHAGVNFIDVMARRGDPGYADAWPFVPGLEVAGTVRALGPGVDGPPPGTRVAAFTGSGGLAEVAVARSALTVAIPEGVGDAEAAAAPAVLTTAALLLGDAGRLRPGETLLVHSAAGGVGQALARQARVSGAGRIVGTVGGPDRIAAGERAGYDVVLGRGADLAAAILEQTDGRGVDVILDPQGTRLLDVDLEVAAPGARIVLFGNAGGAAMDPLPPAGRLFGGNLSIGAFSISRLSAGAPERVARALTTVLADLERGALTVDVTELAGLDATATAQQGLAEGSGAGKQVVRVG